MLPAFNPWSSWLQRKENRNSFFFKSAVLLALDPSFLQLQARKEGHKMKDAE